jgi:hypothetical protein
VSDVGFYHPDRGYWQTNSEPSDAILSSYPAGTKRVSLQPSPRHTFDGEQWVPIADSKLAEILAKEALIERSILLAQTDWWAVQDRTMTQAQVDYRQALRDIPQQAGFPTDITWPTKPE